MEISREFLETVHLSGLVYFDSDRTDLIFVWNNFSTVNIFDRSGRCLDVFTMSRTNELGQAERKQVVESIENHIESILSEE